MEAEFIRLLLDRNLHKRKTNNTVIEAVTDQKSFDELFGLIFHHERPLVIRAIGAVEKITAKNSDYLRPHKTQLLSVLKSAGHKELKWHIPQLMTRIDLEKDELAEVLHILTYWARNKNESKIARVNSLQGLFDLSQQHAELKDNVRETIALLEHEIIPSIQARIRKLKRIDL